MIIFLSGQNKYSLKKYLRRQEELFLEKVNPDSLKIVDGQQSTLSEIGLALNTGSLFSQKRMVVIENIFSNKKAELTSSLYQYLIKKKIAESPDVVIFWSEEADLKKADPAFLKYLKSQKHSQEFPLLSKGEILSWIKKEFNLKKVEIENLAVNELAERCFLNQEHLEIEIHKLSHLKEKISLTDIKNYVSPHYDDNIFALSDALSSQNKKLALEKLSELLSSGLGDDYLLNAMSRHLKSLLIIKSADESGQNQAMIAKENKIHPYVVKKGLLSVKNFSREKLVYLIKKLLQIEYLTRKGETETEKELTLLFSEL